jgi:hypothetical protein
MLFAAVRWSLWARCVLNGEFSQPVRVVAFNTAEGWARDLSEDVARQVVDEARLRGRPLPESVRDFVERLVGEDVSNLA